MQNQANSNGIANAIDAKQTGREVSASQALENYEQHIETAKKRISNLKNFNQVEIPGTATLKLLRGEDKGELSQEKSEALAKSLFENKDLNRFAVVGSLTDSKSLTQKRLSEHLDRVARGKSQGKDVDTRKEQFFRGELVRKNSLVTQVETNFHTGEKASPELVAKVAKELVSQSRVQAYGEQFKDHDLTSALAFKHTSEQCVGYLKMLGDAPVKQFLGKDGKTWVCPIEQLRDQALLKQHQRTLTQEKGMER